MFIISCLCTITVGQDIFWTGTGTNGLWSNPQNWNPPRVPEASDIVEIGNSNTLTLTEPNITIKGLIIRANGSLVLDDENARLNIVDSPAEGIKMLLRGNLTINQGTISIRNPANDGILVDDRSTVINRGSLLINTFGEDGIHIRDNSRVDNYGDLIIDQLSASSPIYGINAEQGELYNYTGATLFVSTCFSPFPAIPMLQITDAFIFEDQGESLFIPRNCN